MAGKQMARSNSEVPLPFPGITNRRAAEFSVITPGILFFFFDTEFHSCCPGTTGDWDGRGFALGKHINTVILDTVITVPKE